MCGISRSTTLVVAYLMTVADISWQDALRCIKYNRSTANPNLGFQSQLQKYQETILEQERKRVQTLFPTYDPLKDQLLLNRSLKAYEKYCKSMDENIFPVPPAGKRRYSWAVEKELSTKSPSQHTKQVPGYGEPCLESTVPELPSASSTSKPERRYSSALSFPANVPKFTIKNEGRESNVSLAGQIDRSSDQSRLISTTPNNPSCDEKKQKGSETDDNRSIRSTSHSDNVLSQFHRLSVKQPQFDTLSVHSDILPLTSSASGSSSIMSQNRRKESPERRNRKKSSPVKFEVGSSPSLQRSAGVYRSFNENQYQRSLQRIDSGEYYDDSDFNSSEEKSYHRRRAETTICYRKSKSHGEPCEDYLEVQYHESRWIPSSVDDEDYDAETDEPSFHHPRSRVTRSRKYSDLCPERTYPNSTPSSPRLRAESSLGRQIRNRNSSANQFTRQYDSSSYAHACPVGEPKLARAMYSRREHDLCTTSRHPRDANKDELGRDSKSRRSAQSLSSSRQSINYQF